MQFSFNMRSNNLALGKKTAGAKLLICLDPKAFIKCEIRLSELLRIKLIVFLLTEKSSPTSLKK